MEYREQLKVIKSHKWDEGDQRKRKPSKKENKKSKKNKKKQPQGAGILDRLLWLIQVLASAFCVGSLLLLGIMPFQYMVFLIVLLAVLLILLKWIQKKRKGKVPSIIVSVLLVLIAFYSLKGNAALDKIAIGEESGDYTKEHAINVTDGTFNVYISGIDVYGEITQSSRSDVNLIATINPKTHKILLTTTPRDYYVTIPGVSQGQRDKLTHAGIYGIETSIATLENLYDTTIPFYVRVNFTSVEEIVDVMGGVDVDSELAFTTGKDAGLVMDVKEGKNHFNGKEALAFVRERQALATGDNQRGKNQQALLTGLIKKAMSPLIVFRANGMINSVTGNAETNMSEKQIKSLIKMQLGDGASWNMESMAAEGDDSGEQWCYSYKEGPLYVTVPYENSVEEIKEKMRQLY